MDRRDSLREILLSDRDALRFGAVEVRGGTFVLREQSGEVLGRNVATWLIVSIVSRETWRPERRSGFRGVFHDTGRGSDEGVRLVRGRSGANRPVSEPRTVSGGVGPTVAAWMSDIRRRNLDSGIGVSCGIAPAGECQ